MTKYEWTKPELSILDVSETLDGDFDNIVEDEEVAVGDFSYGTTNKSLAGS